MKKTILSLTLLLLSRMAFSQEWINYTDGTSIKSITVKGDSIIAGIPGGIARTAPGVAFADVLTPANSNIPEELPVFPFVYTLPDGRVITSLFLKTYFISGNTFTQTDIPFFRKAVTDKNNVVWFATDGFGLVKLDGNSQTIFDESNSDLIDNRILDIGINMGGDSIWISTPSGAQLLAGGNFTSYPLGQSGLPAEGDVGAIGVDSYGRAWLSVTIYDVSDPENNVQIPLLAVFENNQWTVTDTLAVNVFRTDTAGGIWAGGNELYHYNAQKQLSVIQNSGEPKVFAVISLEYYKNGLLVGTNDSGLFLYSDNNFSPVASSNSGLPHSYIEKIVEDKDGNIWIGTSLEGLVKYDGTTWSLYNTSNSLLPQNDITDLEFDKSGNLWVATASEGLVKIAGNTWTLYDTPSVLLDIEFDNNDTLWLAFRGGSIGKFYNNTVTTYLIPGLESSAYVYDLAIDTSGNIWVASEGGLFRFDHHIFIDFTGTLTDRHVRQVAFDPDGKMWVGTNSKGFFVFNGLTVENYNTSNSDLPDNTITEFYFDQNAAWIGTYDGLAKFSGGNFTVYTAGNSGIPNDRIFAITRLSDQRLWLSTVGGIGVFDDGLVTAAAPAEPKETGQISAYPNPTGGKTVIDISDFSKETVIDFFDMSGQSLSEVNSIVKTSDSIEADFSSYKPGVYFCKVYDSNKTRCVRIIVNR